MSGRLLSFSQYLGGADNVKVLEMFPGDQRTFTYDFKRDVSAWTFTADFQSILLDRVSYDRATGEPNFPETTVIGFFDNTTQVPAQFIVPNAIDPDLVEFTIPANRYTGPILPNARENVVMTVLSFEWETDDSPVQKARHRWAILERFDPEVNRNPGNPADDSGFTSFTGA
jgi:hypothetical protein